MQDGPRTKVKKVANRKFTKEELEKRRKEEEQRWADIGERRRNCQSKGGPQCIRGSSTIGEDAKKLNVDHDEIMLQRMEHRFTRYNFCSVDDMIEQGHKLIAKSMSSTEQEYSGATSSTSDDRDTCGLTEVAKMVTRQWITEAMAMVRQAIPKTGHSNGISPGSISQWANGYGARSAGKRAKRRIII